MNISDFIKAYATHPRYKAPTGDCLNARSWQTEAPLRMLLNNLDGEIAENPEELVVYGGIGQAARNPEAVRKIIQILLEMDDCHSLLVQSGKPVGVLPTHPEAPRVLIANSNLVPAWANWDRFNELREKGLMMYGQMTAGSWIYIGTQGILQGTYETFSACADKYFKGSLTHKLLVSGGLGGMGGAQPLAATMAGATFLGADVNPDRIRKRLGTHYLDRMTGSYEEARQWALEAKRNGKAVSIGLISDIGDMLEKLLRDHIIPDVLTDQTSAHDPLNGYIPNGLTLEEAAALRKKDPGTYKKRALRSMARHVGFMLQMQKKGSRIFDYGNNLREFAREAGETHAFDYPGFVPEYIRPLFCAGQGPFRWVALSGNPSDIDATDQALMETFPENERLIRWLKHARDKVKFQGLPSRICWLGMGEREKAGCLFNELVKSGKITAPLVIGRDHLDGGSVASPYRETEDMLDGSDAVSDWPLLNLMINTAGGATWVSFHHGGGVGIGFSQHAGQVIVADGTPDAARRLERVLTTDPGLGVVRHADAGYPEAVEAARQFGIKMPMLGQGA